MVLFLTIFSDGSGKTNTDSIFYKTYSLKCNKLQNDLRAPNSKETAFNWKRTLTSKVSNVKYREDHETDLLR